MKDSTKSKRIIIAVIATMVILGLIMLFVICEDTKAEEIEILVSSYPFWAVTISGDSTFQAVQIIKCWEIFPDGQRELLGYKVTVDSSGHRIYEEEPGWFLEWAVYRALEIRRNLRRVKQSEIPAQRGKGD